MCGCSFDFLEDLYIFCQARFPTQLSEFGHADGIVLYDVYYAI